SSTRAAGVETVSAGWWSTGAPSDSSRALPAGSAGAGMVAGFSRSAGRCPPLVLTGRIWPRRFGSVAHSLALFGIADYEESKHGSERHQIARGLENESACVRRTPRGRGETCSVCQVPPPPRLASKDHYHQYLRVGPAHVRGPHQPGAGHGSRA